MPAAPKGRRKPVVSDSSRSSPSESEQSDFNETVASGRAFGKEQPPPAHGQRRKARPSLALPQPKPALPKNAAGLLIRKSANAGRRLSALVGGAGAAGGGPLAEVEGASRESMEEMSLKFEEWMKMATDNVRFRSPCFDSIGCLGGGRSFGRELVSCAGVARRRLARSVLIPPSTASSTGSRTRLQLAWPLGGSSSTSGYLTGW